MINKMTTTKIPQCRNSSKIQQKNRGKGQNGYPLSTNTGPSLS